MDGYLRSHWLIRHRPSAIRLFRQTPDGGSLLLLIQANEIRAQRLNKTRNLPNIDRWRRSREEQGGGGERKCGQPSQWSTSSDTSDTSDIFRHRLRLGGIGINQSQSKPIRAALSLSLDASHPGGIDSGRSGRHLPPLTRTSRFAHARASRRASLHFFNSSMTQPGPQQQQPQ